MGFSSYFRPILLIFLNHIPPQLSATHIPCAMPAISPCPPISPHFPPLAPNFPHFPPNQDFGVLPSFLSVIVVEFILV